MTKRRIWGDREPIAGADLTDIGNYSESATGDLALGFGPGILQGLGAAQTTTPSASIIVKAGKVLVTDPGVGRPRLLDLPADVALSFASKSIGSYAVVITALEAGEDTRTILPPPVGHPFYEAGSQSYQLATVQHWIASLSLQAMPYSPTGAQSILATVNWGGASVQTADIAQVLDYPVPLVATGGLLPSTLSSALAGPGLSRSATGVLSARADTATVTLNAQGQLTLSDGGVSDTAIGPRSIVPLPLPASPTALGTLAANLGWIGQALVSITGEGTWQSPVATSLHELNANATRRGNNEVIGGNWSFAAPLTVPAGTAPGHAVQKGYVDSAFGSAGNAASAALNTHRQNAVLDHPDGSVTDAKLGSRTVGEAASLPATLAQQATVQGAFDWLGRVIRDIKGGQHWYDPAANLTDLASRLSVVEAASGSVPDGSVTDARIGQRTLLDTVVPSGNTALLTPLLSGLANRLKALTGEVNWQVNPATTVAELNANAARKGNNETVTGSWTYAAPITVPAPTNPGHAASKGYVDSVSGAAGSVASALTAHRTQAILDHPDGSVTGAKLAPSAVQDRLGFLPFNPAGGDVGSLRVTTGGESLKLLPGSSNFTALGLYARDTSTRSGIFGYLSAGSPSLELKNELAGANLILAGGAGGAVQVNSPLQSSGSITAAGELTAHNGYGDSISLGGDAANGDFELRLGVTGKPLSIFSPSGAIGVNVVGSLNAQTLTGTDATLTGTVTANVAVIGGQTVRSAGGALKLGGVVVDALNVGTYPVWHAGNLDPVALANSANISGATVLSRLTAVDGSGSGLDSDLLDGLHATDFARAVHTHTRSQITDFAHGHVITDLPVAASGEASAAKLVRADDARLSDARTPTAHTHSKAQISDFAHTHPASEISGLQGALDSKANVAHGHAISDVAGLQGALDGKAAVSHRHNFSEIDGRPATLAGYGIQDGSAYDISGFVAGRPPQASVVLAFVAARTTTIQAANPGSARVLTAPQSVSTFSVQNEAGTQVGTITFPAGSSVGNVALTGDVILQAGQLLVARSTGNRDANLSDLSVTFRGRY